MLFRRNLFRLTGLTAALLALSATAADAPKGKPEAKGELRKKLLAAKEAIESNPAYSAQTKQEKLAELRKQVVAAGIGKGKAAPSPAAPPVQTATTPAPANTLPIKAITPSAPKDATPLARLIDKHVDAKLATGKVPVSPAASDDEFVRRIYLDLTGAVPTAVKAREFLASADPAKRAKLIDELLADPAYGRHQADLWEPRLIPVDSMNRFVPREPFTKWLGEQFNQNTPWNQFVGSIVSATGTIKDNPAVSYFLLNRSVDKLTDGVSRNFLGVQLQCAQCHNHPFTETKQVEYWGMATFFGKVQPERPGNPNKTGKDVLTLGVREGATKNKQKDFFPESAKTVPAKFLGGEQPKLSETEAYRPALAAWIASPDNPFLARAMVNRTWGQMFGAGIVDPVDDLDGEHEASHPELLDALTKKFADSGFDVKHLIRGICQSKAYQRTSKPVKGNEDDERLLSHRTVKVMTPEQLFDSVVAVVGGADEKVGTFNPAAGRYGPATPRQQFVQFYLAGAEVADQTEYEAGIPQVLKLMNSRMGGGSAALRNLAKPGMRPAEVVEAIYLATLSRKPTPAETSRLLAHVETAKTPADGLGDVLWAVLNSSEFTMIR